MSRTMEMLRKEHRDLAKLVRILEDEMGRLEEGEAMDLALARDILDYVSNYPDRIHHREEDIVFARLAERDPGSRDAVEKLREEHEKMVALTRETVILAEQVALQMQVPRDEVVGKVRAYADMLRRHMATEEEYLFPLAEQKLTDEDWADIDLRTTAEDDPVFGAAEKDKYRMLRRSITTE